MTLKEDIKDKAFVYSGGPDGESNEAVTLFDAESIARRHLIAFGAWYSGMKPAKVETAFERYEAEMKSRLLNSLPVFIHTKSGKKPTTKQLKAVIKIVDEHIRTPKK